MGEFSNPEIVQESQSSDDVAWLEQSELQESPLSADNVVFASQERQLLANERLMQSFFVENEGIIYPDWYSNCYIEDDYLYVCLVEGASVTETYLNNIFGEYSDAVKYEHRTSSLNELKKVSNEYAEILIDEGCELVEYSIDDFSGDLTFSVKEGSKDTAEALLNTTATASIISNNSIRVNIEVCDEIDTQEEVFCGAPLGSTSSRSNYTLGIFGSYNGSMAFATCGHMTSAGVGDSIYYNDSSTIIGTMVVKQYSNNASGDYAICTMTNHTLMPTNIIGTASESYEITSTTLVAPAGTNVIKYGKNGGFATARIITTNTTFVDTVTGGEGSTMVIYGISKAQLLSGNSLGGDSGGPYITDNISFCGTHTGYSTKGYVYFSQYQNLVTAGFSAFLGY